MWAYPRTVTATLRANVQRRDVQRYHDWLREVRQTLRERRQGFLSMYAIPSIETPHPPPGIQPVRYLALIRFDQYDSYLTWMKCGTRGCLLEQVQDIEGVEQPETQQGLTLVNLPPQETPPQENALAKWRLWLLVWLCAMALVQLHNAIGLSAAIGKLEAPVWFRTALSASCVISFLLYVLLPLVVRVAVRIHFLVPTKVCRWQPARFLQVGLRHPFDPPHDIDLGNKVDTLAERIESLKQRIGSRKNFTNPQPSTPGNPVMVKPPEYEPAISTTTDALEVHSMENPDIAVDLPDATQPGVEDYEGDGVTLVAHHNIKWESTADFEEWLRGNELVLSTFSGYLGSVAFRPPSGETHYNVVMRFETVDDMEAWKSSKERQARISLLAPWLQSSSEVRHVVGNPLGALSTTTSCSASLPPSLFTTNVLTHVSMVIVLTFVNDYVPERLVVHHGWAKPFVIALVMALATFISSFFLAPFLFMTFRGWVQSTATPPIPSDARWIWSWKGFSLRPQLILATMYMGIMILLWRVL